jgi:hypothetical protein
MRATWPVACVSVVGAWQGVYRRQHIGSRDPDRMSGGMDSIEPFLPRTRIAYFSMEIALRPEMHTYAGGLCVLAGDTARSSADLELPIVFVSLISRAGCNIGSPSKIKTLVGSTRSRDDRGFRAQDGFVWIASLPGGGNTMPEPGSTQAR